MVFLRSERLATGGPRPGETPSKADMRWISTVAVEANGIRVGTQAWEWSAIQDVSRTDLFVVGRLTVRIVDGTRMTAWGSRSAAKALERAVEEGLSSWATASKTRVLEASQTLQAFLDSD